MEFSWLFQKLHLDRFQSINLTEEGQLPDIESWAIRCGRSPARPVSSGVILYGWRKMLKGELKSGADPGIVGKDDSS